MILMVSFNCLEIILANASGQSAASALSEYDDASGYHGNY
jgi:hypothetical protein